MRATCYCWFIRPENGRRKTWDSPVACPLWFLAGETWVWPWDVHLRAVHAPRKAGGGDEPNSPDCKSQKFELLPLRTCVRDSQIHVHEVFIHRRPLFPTFVRILSSAAKIFIQTETEACTHFCIELSNWPVPYKNAVGRRITSLEWIGFADWSVASEVMTPVRSRPRPMSCRPQVHYFVITTCLSSRDIAVDWFNNVTSTLQVASDRTWLMSRKGFGRTRRHVLQGSV